MENNGDSVTVLPSNKQAKTDPIDQLSALPDSLLILILNRLRSNKVAASTSVLSRRWQYLWTELPHLNFMEESIDFDKTREFVCRVHRTLALRSKNSLCGLCINFAYDNVFAPDVNTWVEYVARNKVETFALHLRSSGDSFYTLPLAMYSCSSLSALYLKRCVFSPLRTIKWKSLGYLTIDEMELPEHVIQNILSGCPELYTLDIISCWGFGCLDINNMSLHNFSLSDNGKKATGPLLEISAPYIRNININDYPIGKKKLRLKNILFLDSAEINFCMLGVTEEHMTSIVEFFEDIRHVDELLLKLQTTEILSLMVENGWKLPQSTRTCLTVEIFGDANTLSSFLVLLESSPNLESLVIICPNFYEECYSPVAGIDLTCDLVHLKTVELIKCANPKLDGEPMLTMARILLKRAPSLEEMTVTGEGFAESSLEVFYVIQELLSFPRSSQKATVVFQQGPC